MSNFIEYISTPAVRNKVVNNIQKYTLAGGLTAAFILLVATLAR